MLEIPDIASRGRRARPPYRFAIVARSKRRATRADRARFAVGADAWILALRCRHDAERRPFCLEDRLISLAAAPDAADEPFAALSPGAWLVPRIPWTRAEHRIRAAAARREVARALSVADGRRVWSSSAAPGAANRR